MALFIVAALAPSVALAANPWTRDAGEFYLNANVSTIRASSFYSPEGDINDLGNRYSQVLLGVYGELGIIDRWLTATADGVLLRSSSIADQGSVTGFGDIRLGVASGLIVLPVRLTATLTVGIPTRRRATRSRGRCGRRCQLDCRVAADG